MSQETHWELSESLWLVSGKGDLRCGAEPSWFKVKAPL